jgi:energy-coupling factor transporter transmembrane protein EcfT
MVELNLFHYLPRHSVLHRMDARLKLAGVAFLSVAVSLSTGKVDLFLVTIVLAGAVGLARLPVGLFLGELWRFAYLIAATFVINVIGSSGAPLFPWLPGITRAGLIAGLIWVWRLCAVLVIGLLLTGSTQLSELRAAVFWYFRPLPGRAAARLATMLSLTLSLIPLIFDQAATIREAQLSRGVALVKNPLRRLRYLVGPLLRETFRRVDELVLAMESRCYNEERTQPAFEGTVWDTGALGLALFLLGMVIWF